MNASRLAVWIAGAAVFGAWLASAAGITRQAQRASIPPRAPETVQLDALAAEVQAQAGRLRERLANAPAPPPAARNPFSFYSARAHDRVTPARARAIIQPEPDPIVPAAQEPPLELIGVAETSGPGGPVRTALIAGGFDDLIMVIAGQRILSRYDVVSVAADAVELKDIDSGVVRRLVLR